jgi:hypothetical protein
MATLNKPFQNGFTVVELLIAGALTVLVIFGALSVFTMGTKESKRSLSSFDEKSNIELFSKELQKLIKNTDSSIVFSSTAAEENGRPAYFPAFLASACSELHDRDLNLNLNCPEKVAALFAEVLDVSVTGVCLIKQNEYGLPTNLASPNSRYLLIDLNNQTYGRPVFTPQQTSGTFTHAFIDIAPTTQTTTTAPSRRGSGPQIASTTTTSSAQFSGRLILGESLSLHYPPLSYSLRIASDTLGRPVVLSSQIVRNRSASSAEDANLPQDCFNNLLKVSPSSQERNGSQLIAVAVEPLVIGELMNTSGNNTPTSNYLDQIPMLSPVRINQLILKSLGYVPTQSAFTDYLAIGDCNIAEGNQLTAIQCDQSQITHSIDNVSDYKIHLSFDSPLGSFIQTEKFELSTLPQYPQNTSSSCVAPLCRGLQVPGVDSVRIYAQGTETSQQMNPYIYSFLKNKIIKKVEILIDRNSSDSSNSQEKVVVRAFNIK